MSAISGSDDQYALEDSASIAVIGGGPTGSFFSIFLLKMAKMVGKKLNVTIFEPKDFSKDGPRGCNHCGGVISELLVQMLAVEGINLPDSVVQRGINSYKLHTHLGSVQIATPSFEKTIATVYRGGGPKGIVGREKESFDNYLLYQAIQEGAVHNHARIDRVEYRNKRPVLFSQGQKILEADLVVGAFGVNSQTAKVFEDMGFGYKKPAAVRAAIAEIGLGKSIISEHLCVPLKYKERIFGVLNMSNSSEKLFTLDDLKLLHTLSITASMAVQNAMNYSHLKYATDEVIKHATMLGMW